jgi:hypothetical protein
MVEIFSTSPWPGDLWDFAFFPERDRALRELAELAEPEDWTYKGSGSLIGTNPYFFIPR